MKQTVQELETSIHFMRSACRCCVQNSTSKTNCTTTTNVGWVTQMYDILFIVINKCNNYKTLSNQCL